MVKFRSYKGYYTTLFSFVYVAEKHNSTEIIKLAKKYIKCVNVLKHLEQYLPVVNDQ